MKLCDLHTHTTFSDGTLTPTELVELARQEGVSAIALTDHNSVAGLPEFMAAGEKSTVRTVPGIEFSTDYRGKELHIVMLFVKEQDYAQITEMMEQLRRNKEQSNRDLVTALQKAGMHVDYDALAAQTPDGYINRAHIAMALVEGGYVQTRDEAFKGCLKSGGGFYTPPKMPDAFEIIRFIKEKGGVAILAHPFLSLDEAQLLEFLPEAVACGLDAMETLYTKYDAQTTQKARQLADQFGLLESGGSDFHGANKPDTLLGRGWGQLEVPLTVLEKLEERIKY